MGAVKMYRNASLPSPGTMAADQVRYVKVGSSYIQYVIDNSGVAIPPAVMAHTHNIADVTGLQTALDGKSDTGHTHTNATITVAGFMSAADKVKLDGLSNYTHPNSGVTAGTYRSVTVDAMGHVTAGTNPNTLAGYGITQRYVSLDPTDGFATPVQSSYDLNSAALTAYGFATTATNRPTGAAASGYFSTNSIDSTSFFQTFANPTVQDAFFYRRRNTSTNYAWLRVASREWVATQISGTVNQVPLFTGTNTLGDSILSQSGINVTAAGQFVSDVAPSGTGSRGFGFFASGSARWTIGKFGLETGSNAGSNLVFYRFTDTGAFLGEAMSINRATGNVTYSGIITASGGNSTQWNAAVPSTRTITINGTTFDLSANRSWTVAGGIGGSGTNGFVTKWNGANLADSSLDDSDTNYLSTSKGFRFAKGSGTWYFTAEANSSSGNIIFTNPSNVDKFLLAGSNTGLDILIPGVGYIVSFLNSRNIQAYGQIESLTSTGTAPFVIGSTTMVPNLNADMVDGLHASSFALASSLSGYVPTSRTITINGTTFDLSANRSWTVSGGMGGSGTAGKIPKLTASTTLGDSILTESGINITAAGQFISDVAHNSNIRGFGLQALGVNRWTFGKAGTESGSDSGSDFTLWSYSDAGSFVREPLRISRANGNATFSGAISVSGGNSGQWNTAYSWNNHATAGYATVSYLTTNYYTKTSIDGMVSGFVPDSRSVIGTGSIQGGGNLGINRTLNLYGDQDNPGTNKYYGTDGSGGKGWYNLPSGGGVPTSRVLTINGVSQDLSLDRSWSISTGISGSGSTNMFTKWSGSGSVTYAEMYEVSTTIYVGSSGNRRHLVVQGSLVPIQMTAAEKSGYAPGYIGALVYQTDGTQGLYIAKDNGSGGHTWVFIG